MNKIKKSIKRTTTLIAILAIGIIILPTLLSNNESSVNPITTIALVEIGENEIVQTFEINRPSEIPKIQNGQELVDGYANWYDSGLQNIQTYCINYGWSDGDGEGYTIDELNEMIRGEKQFEIQDTEPKQSRTYYRFVKEHDDLRMFEKYVLSIPTSWFDGKMQAGLWNLAGDPDSVLYQYGSNSISPSTSMFLYSLGFDHTIFTQNPSGRPVYNGTDGFNTWSFDPDMVLLDESNMQGAAPNSTEDFSEVKPKTVIDTYNDLIDNLIPNKEKEIEEYKNTIDENNTKIKTINNEIKALFDKLTEVDSSWELTNGSNALKFTVNYENAKNNETIEISSETKKEAEKQANNFLKEEKNKISSKTNNQTDNQTNNKINEIENITKKILEKELNILNLQITNENLTKIKIPNDEDELEKLKNDVQELIDTFGDKKENTVTLESATAAINKSKAFYQQVIRLNLEGRAFEKFYEEIVKQVNSEQMEPLISDLNNAGSVEDMEGAINGADIQEHIKNGLLVLLIGETGDFDTLKAKVIEKANGFKVDKPSLNVVNKTDMTNLKVVVDQETNEYIAGPFVLSYVNGTMESVSFGGITNMELVGETNDSIPITGFVVDENKDGDFSNDTWIGEDEIHYYTPDPVELVDREAQRYPKPGLPFYVRFSDPRK